jgi:hypothetical protein
MRQSHFFYCYFLSLWFYHSLLFYSNPLTSFNLQFVISFVLCKTNIFILSQYPNIQVICSVLQNISWGSYKRFLVSITPFLCKASAIYWTLSYSLQVHVSRTFSAGATIRNGFLLQKGCVAFSGFGFSQIHVLLMNIVLSGYIEKFYSFLFLGLFCDCIFHSWVQTAIVISVKLLYQFTIQPMR